ncbi:hypothetical protein [Pantoea sp. At-9b]|uniref:hypothetical protein n=1 Tax=Pantoea sp. (strain At-9b) TaxID=592316 RepID=UPI00167F903B|nr:hypothetical protein [Pantoea sp. At-9b]
MLAIITARWITADFCWIKQHSLLISGLFFSLFALHHRAKIPRCVGLTFFCS